MPAFKEVMLALEALLPLDTWGFCRERAQGWSGKPQVRGLTVETHALVHLPHRHLSPHGCGLWGAGDKGKANPCCGWNAQRGHRGLQSSCSD